MIERWSSLRALRAKPLMSAALTLQSLMRIMFLRGSPERILYSRKLFIGALASALLASGVLQFFGYGDHLVFVILRVFAEITMFMLWMVFMTAKVARLRLANMMLVLMMISLIVDIVTTLVLLPTPMEVRTSIGIVIGLVAAYGVSNVVAWALRKPVHIGALYFGLYYAAVTGLDLAFRGLYGVMAG